MKSPQVERIEHQHQKTLFITKNIRKHVVHDPHSSNIQKLLGQSNPAQNEQIIQKVLMAKFGSLPFNH